MNTDIHSADDSSISMNYEYFLKRAFKYNKSLRRPSNREYINLIYVENGTKYPGLPSFEKQLEDIKKRLNKAILIFISKSNDKEQIKKLEELDKRVSKISTYNDISEILNEGLEVTQNFI